MLGWWWFFNASRFYQKAGSFVPKHILPNNNCHDPVGGQTTYADKINYKNFSKSIGFGKFYLINNKKYIE